MRKTVLIAALLIPFSSFSQIKDLMLKKVGGMTKKEGTSNTTASDTTQKTTKPETQTNPWAAKMGSKSDAQTEYVFNSNALVEMQNYKKNGETDGDAAKVRYHFSDNDYFGTEMQSTDKKGKTTESFGVSEFSKNQLISLINTDGEKTGTVMKIDMQKAVEKQNDTSNVTVTKTGKTKTILGYNCEEYLITDKDGNNTQAWMTTALPFDMKKMMAGDRSSKNSYGGYADGFMMEMVSNQKNGEKTTWKVLEVNTKNEKKIITGDYTFPF